MLFRDFTCLNSSSNCPRILKVYSVQESAIEGKEQQIVVTVAILAVMAHLLG